MDVTDDTRNVADEFRGKSVDEIKSALESRSHKLHIAIENLERDFNMGTIVRSANAFNAGTVHIIGRRQWNKRGAMATNLYMNIEHHADISDFLNSVKGMSIIGIDNIDGSVPLADTELPEKSVLVFGSEGDGLSREMIEACDKIVAIEQFGSTRSVNVGVAAGIAMYAWLQQNILNR